MLWDVTRSCALFFDVVFRMVVTACLPPRRRQWDCDDGQGKRLAYQHEVSIFLIRTRQDFSSSSRSRTNLTFHVRCAAECAAQMSRKATSSLCTSVLCERAMPHTVGPISHVWFSTKLEERTEMLARSPLLPKHGWAYPPFENFLFSHFIL